MSLKLNEKQELDALSSALKDVIEAGAALDSLDDIFIVQTSFPDLTPEQREAAPNAAADIAELQNELEKAQGHILYWVNEIAPEITILPQAFINVGTFVNAWEPKVGSLDHSELLEVLRGTADKLGAQADKLAGLGSTVQGLTEKLSVDAANFSETHGAFSELEQLDAENIKATKAALDKIEALIKQESETIDIDLLDAEDKIEIAKAVMDAGKDAEGEGSEWIKIAVAIVGIVLIALAEKEIDEALATIAERLKNAEKESEYQINFNALTYQLVSLHTANKVLASANTEVADVYRVFSSSAQWFRDRQSDLNAIVAAGAPQDQVNDVSLRTYAKTWQTLMTAGTNWQNMEITTPETVRISLAGFGKNPASATAGGQK